MSLLLLAFALASENAERVVGDELDRVLFSRISLEWKPRPLGDALRELALEHNLNLVIDGRVNQSYMVHGEPRDMPLEMVFTLVTQLVKAKPILIGDVLYVRPDELCDKIAASALTGRAQLEKDKRSSPSQPLLQRVDLEWDDNAELAPLIGRVLDETGYTIELPDPNNPKLAKSSVANVRRLDLVNLLLAHADVTAKTPAENKILTQAPIVSALQVQVRFDSSADARNAARNYASVVEGVELKPHGASLTVTGPWSKIRTVRMHLTHKTREQVAGAPSAQSKGSEKKKSGKPLKRFTLKASNVTLRTFIKAVEEKTERTVTLDQQSFAAAGKTDLARISCSARNVSLESLLRITLIPAGFTFRIASDGDITIYAKSDGD